jgi:hypothetical protein
VIILTDSEAAHIAGLLVRVSPRGHADADDLYLWVRRLELAGDASLDVLARMGLVDL